MNSAYISIFEERLKVIKKKIKKHICQIPRDKVKREVVSNLLKDANKLKKIIIQYRKENRKDQVVMCPHCSKEFII